jgi:chemotaxis protein methyltransferase CheR
VASLGCSTGEEPISLAISLIDSGAQPGSFEIHASDIDTEILSQAKSGQFHKDKSSNLPHSTLNKHFTIKGNLIQVSDSILKSIRFSRINLVKDINFGSPSEYDSVMCRNALIYFTPETQQKVLSKICDSLMVGGLLCLGHAELLSDTNSYLQLISQSTYIKKK